VIFQDQEDLTDLTVRPITSEEKSRWIRLMDDHHYLGFRQLVGTYICYVALLKGEWVGLLGWSWAAFKCGARDRWIGWDESLKWKRLKHVLNNTRFLILPGISIKNLASKILSLNTKRLSSDWEKIYGHPIILAETFVDPSRFRGTCYKAQGWIELGTTRGFGKNGKGYVQHNTPKKILVFPLHRKAREILSAPFVSPHLISNKEVLMMDVNKLPLQGQGGLIDLLATIVDPRKKRGVRYSHVAMLALALCACISGVKSYEGMIDYAQSLPPDALRLLGFRRGKPPSESALRRFLQRLNAEEIDRKVGDWFLKQTTLKGAAIALDGKTLCGSHNGTKKAIQLLGAILHKEGIVIAQKKIADKTNEIPMVKELLDPLEMEGAIATLDALHTQTKTAKYLVEEKKADYVFIAKDNQETLKNDIAAVADDDFSPSAY
jgi:hypothetical protein